MLEALFNPDLCSVLVLLGPIVGLVLGAGTQADRDLIEVSRFPLSPESIGRYVEAREQLGLPAHVYEKDQIDLTARAAALERVCPQAASLLARHGLAPRDYVAIPFALRAVRLTLAFERLGRRLMVAGGSLANLEMLRRHERELQPLLDRLDRLEAQAGVRRAAAGDPPRQPSAGSRFNWSVLGVSSLGRAFTRG